MEVFALPWRVQIYSSGVLLILGLSANFLAAHPEEEDVLDALGDLSVETPLGPFMIHQSALANCCDLKAGQVQIHLGNLSLSPGKHRITVRSNLGSPAVFNIAIAAAVTAQAAA